MRLEPGQWYCDTCGGIIASAEDGYIEWKRYVYKDGTRRDADFHLVHHYSSSPYRETSGKGCYYESPEITPEYTASSSNLDLKHFLGPSGLVRFSELLLRPEFPKAELIIMMQRVLVPGYEMARRYFVDAEDQGIIESTLPKPLYWPEDIQTVIDSIERLDSC